MDKAKKDILYPEPNRAIIWIRLKILNPRADVEDDKDAEDGAGGSGSADGGPEEGAQGNAPADGGSESAHDSGQQGNAPVDGGAAPAQHAEGGNEGDGGPEEARTPYAGKPSVSYPDHSFRIFVTKGTKEIQVLENST